MASYNKIILVGNLTRNPETKQLPSGVSVTTLGLATNHRYKTSSGEQREEVCYIDVTVWGLQGENCSRYLSMGSSVLVEGRLRQNSWEDKETGKKRYGYDVTADVVRFLNSSSNNGENVQKNIAPQKENVSKESSFSPPPAQQPNPMPNYDSFDDDDVPF